MTEYGILVPAARSDRHDELSWVGGELSEVLTARIGDGLLSAVTVAADSAQAPGGLRLWRRDPGPQRRRQRRAAVPDPNDRAVAIARYLGYPVRELAGPVVFVGALRGPFEAGLHPVMWAWLGAALDAQFGGGRQWPRMGAG